MPTAAVRALGSLDAPALPIECGSLEVHVSDRIRVRLGRWESDFIVVAGPGLLLGEPPPLWGEATGIFPAVQLDEKRIALDALDSHPAASLPALGDLVETEVGARRVVGLDVPGASVMMADPGQGR